MKMALILSKTTIKAQSGRLGWKHLPQAKCLVLLCYGNIYTQEAEKDPTASPDIPTASSNNYQALPILFHT